MTYKINDTELTLQPTTGRWLPRTELGIDGNGHSMYEPTYSFEIRWQLISPSEYNQIKGFFDAQGQTGTSSIDLPQYGAATYAFHTYSGCVINEPQVEVYFTETQLNAYLLVRKIRV